MTNSILINHLNVHELKEILANEVQKGIQMTLQNLQKSKPEVEFITRKDTASILGISLVTLHEWTKTGRVPAYRIGSRVRYKLNEVYDCASKMKVA